MPTYYLNADTGNDSTGDGSSGNPWLTISKAHTAAASGDTIILQTSTASYTLSNQTFSKSLTFQGAAIPTFSGGVWSGSVLDAGGSNVLWQLGTSSLALSYENLVFTGVDKTGTTEPFFKNNLVSTLSFTRCVVDDNILFANNGISGNGFIGAVGANVDATITFTGCVVSRVTFTPGTAFDCFIGFYLSTPGLTIEVDMYNNAFYMAGAIISARFADPLDVGVWKNNCFASPSTWDDLIQYNLNPSGTVPTFENNRTYNYTNVPAGSNNTTGDPIYIDPANGDLRRSPLSPLAGAGAAI